MTKRISKYKLLRYYRKDLFSTLRLMDRFVRKIIPTDAIIATLRYKHLVKQRRGLISRKAKFFVRQRKTGFVLRYKKLKFNTQNVKRRIKYKKNRKLGQIQRRLGKKFYYRVDIGEPGRKKRRMTLFAKRLLNRHKVRFATGLMTLKTFRRYIKIAFRYNKLFRIFNKFLESRLDFFLRRINLPLFSIQQIRQFINHGGVTINGKISNMQGYQLKLFDIVSVVRTRTMYYFFYNLFRFSGIDIHLANIPKYIEMNFRTFSAILLYYPKTREIPMFPYINSNKILISGKRFKG